MRGSVVVLITAPDAGPDISDDETTSHPAVRNVTVITLGKLSGAMENSLSLRTVFEAAQAIASTESDDFGPGFAKQYNQCPRSRILHINSSEFAADVWRRLHAVQKETGLEIRYDEVVDDALAARVRQHYGDGMRVYTYIYICIHCEGYGD